CGRDESGGLRSAGRQPIGPTAGRRTRPVRRPFLVRFGTKKVLKTIDCPAIIECLLRTFFMSGSVLPPSCWQGACRHSARLVARHQGRGRNLSCYTATTREAD